MYNENEIIEQLKNPATQKSAFEKVVVFYSEKIYWQVRKMVVDHDDANDLVQNVFLKAWLNIHLFRGDSRLSTWLYRIAINECITFLNSQRQKSNVSIDDADVFLLDKLQSDEYFDGDEAALKLQEAILRLPEKQRIVFNLRYYEEMGYEQMSEVLGTSVGALKASYHHAVKKIEQSLASEKF